jgi:DNA-binding response OmpR family regulator
MEPNVTEKHYGVRVLAVVPVELQPQIRRQLGCLGVTIDFVDRATELSHLALIRTSYHVAILPAAFPDTSWWSLWGEITLLHPRPEILVYAHTADFRLWSGVLEVGGYDVIVEPFTDEELQGAVRRAARSFSERCLKENDVE